MSLVPPTLETSPSGASFPAEAAPSPGATPEPAPEREPSAGSKFVVRAMMAALWSPFVVTGVAFVIALTCELLKRAR